MQVRRGKGWEIWSRAVTLGRQVLDTWGRCPMRNLKALSCAIGPRAGGQSISKAVSIPSVIHSARDDLTPNRNYYCWAPPQCVHHLSIWRNRTWPNLPGLPPLYLHTVSDQVLEVGTAWEWGYHDPLLFVLYLTWAHKQMHLWNGKDQMVQSCAPWPPVLCTVPFTTDKCEWICKKDLLRTKHQNLTVFNLS